MFVSVLVEIKSKKVDKTFSYHVPDFLEKDISVGKRVLVPFGKIKFEGYVLDIINDPLIETKDIIDVLDSFSVLNEEMLELGKYMKEKTISSLSACYDTMLPKAYKAQRKSLVNDKNISYLYLNKIDENLNDSQKKIISLFKDERILKSDALKISVSSTNTLIKKGIVIEKKEKVNRFRIDNFDKRKEVVLNEEQNKAINSIKNCLNTEKTFLLHGVTGSGKTEVYLSVIDEVLKSGKSSIVLVPEISLTPQFVSRFYSKFKDTIAVLHSGLSDGEKKDEWQKIINKEVKIVIGARSAIFAPLDNIGIIIMDECHSESYNQDSSPRYHTIDIALFRQKRHHCPIVLGSATPLISDMARALKGVYTYIPLKNRVNNMYPDIKIVDMEEEARKGYHIISRELISKIKEKIALNEQVMLLLNRRGHSTNITCSNCGFTYKCPYCDITLTYHKSSKSMRCHYCGYTKFVDAKCPKCHEESLNYLGLGTEKLEEYLKNNIKDAKIIRMDRDSTSKKGSHEKITKDFLDGKYNILLGTQMISKGLDFNNVTLVGIISADSSLNIPSYKSLENTFDLLSQASGRAGRSNKRGEVLIQTYNKDNHIFAYIKNNDYLSFYKEEMHNRKLLKYPPYYFLVTIIIKSKDYKLASEESIKVKNYLTDNLSKESIVLGPSTSNMFIVNKTYHFEVLTKYRFDDKIYTVLKDLDDIYVSNRFVDISFIFEE